MTTPVPLTVLELTPLGSLGFMAGFGLGYSDGNGAFVYGIRNNGQDVFIASTSTAGPAVQTRPVAGLGGGETLNQIAVAPSGVVGLLVTTLPRILIVELPTLVMIGECTLVPRRQPDGLSPRQFAFDSLNRAAFAAQSDATRSGGMEGVLRIDLEAGTCTEEGLQTILGVDGVTSAVSISPQILWVHHDRRGIEAMDIDPMSATFGMYLNAPPFRGTPPGTPRGYWMVRSTVGDAFVVGFNSSIWRVDADDSPPSYQDLNIRTLGFPIQTASRSWFFVTGTANNILIVDQTQNAVASQNVGNFNLRTAASHPFNDEIIAANVAFTELFRIRFR